MPSSEWYYVQDRQKVGPLSKEQIRSLYEKGALSGHDLVWTQGMSEWKPASQVHARFAPPAHHPAKPPAAVAAEDNLARAIDLEEPAPMADMETAAAAESASMAGMQPGPAAEPAPMADMESDAVIESAPPAVKRPYDVGEGLGIDRTYAPTTERQFASFGARLGAFLIDSLIVFVLNMIVMALGIGALLFMGSLLMNSSAGESLVTILTFGMYALMTAVPWLYFARQESGMKMATIGKRVVGIQVIDADGYPVSFLRATGRHFAKVISAMPCYIGFLFPLFTAKKQALHDLVASTLVVKGKA